MAASEMQFYMYQSADGQWIFLHPLNIRCLLEHYGSYDACPSCVCGTILELENVLQNEFTRKRWRFSAHLPLTASFRLCEISLSEILPGSALQPFMGQLEARERRRQLRAEEQTQAILEEERALRAANSSSTK